MRRVDRGPWPLDEENREKRFRPYRKAKADLLAKLGNYCSYCERPGDLHVEHVIPVKHREDLEGEWTNFLLGCANCNGTKQHRNQSRDGYLWSDEDDTQAVFEYLPEGIVRVRADIPEPDRTEAKNLFNLVGLGRRPTNDPRASDLRWRKRREAWRTAEVARQKIADGDDPEWVIRLAQASGFWSVWMAVFHEYPDVRDRLERGFPGTRR